MPIRKRAIAALMVLFTCVLAWGGNPLPWSHGENLEYDIGYGFLTAGQATLKTRPIGDSLIEFQTLATNNGFFETVYPVKDTILTRVRRKGFIPESFRKINHEGGYHARSQIHFDWLHQRAHLSDSVFAHVEGPLKRNFDSTVSISGEYHCIISAFYKVRSMYLEPGKVNYLQAVSGKKKYRMRVLVHGRETVTVPAGTFKCLVVEPVLDGDGIFQAKGSLTIWLSDDARRLPVLMKSKIQVGSIRAELRSWSMGAEALFP
ncbi:MAG TPA: DUF3108 domain-containing protein [Fibrobacteraceae bacterium]|nr:DUF3108 domain-containing protein [Fibrobacteraceae bacterium]